MPNDRDFDRAEPASVLVRDRRAADADALAPALAHVHRIDGYPIMEEHANAEWLFSGDVDRAWVAELGGECVAHVSVVHAFDAPGLSDALGGADARALGLTRLFVAPSGRGHGVASSLLTRAEEHAAAARKPLALEVVEHNSAAIALYERRGWHRVNTYAVSWFGDSGPHPIAHVYLAPQLPVHP